MLSYYVLNMQALVASVGFNWLAACTVVLVALVVVAAIVRSRRQQKAYSSYRRDIVTLFQPGRGPWAPSISPYALKLETYLRMANIPYQNVFGFNRSSKCKIAWALYDGEALPDSHFAMEKLGRKFGIDFRCGFSAEQRAQGWSYQVLAEEHFAWALSLWRFKYGLELPESWEMMAAVFPGFTTLKVKVLGKGFVDGALAQGMGRHDRHEVQELGLQDLKALSAFLGDKPYFMGAEPCEHDCAIFAILAQVYWQSPGSPYERILRGECYNLAGFCERVRTRYWPDWDDCITHGGNIAAEK